MNGEVVQDVLGDNYALIMSEQSEHKSWSAAAHEAYSFFVEHGGDATTGDDRLLYEAMIADVQARAAMHDGSLNDRGFD